MPVIALVWMAGEKGARCMTPRIPGRNSRKQIGICFLPFSLPVLCVQLPLPHAVDVVRDGSCQLWLFSVRSGTLGTKQVLSGWLQSPDTWVLEWPYPSLDRHVTWGPWRTPRLSWVNADGPPPGGS